MPPAETPTQWKVGNFAIVDKDCTSRNTRAGQYVVCVGVETSSAETPSLQDVGTFAVVDTEDEANEIATVLASSSIGPFSSSMLPRPADFQFNSLLVGVSKSVLCQITSNWRKLTVEPHPRGIGDQGSVDTAESIGLALSFPHTRATVATVQPTIQLAVHALQPAGSLPWLSRTRASVGLPLSLLDEGSRLLGHIPPYEKRASRCANSHRNLGTTVPNTILNILDLQECQLTSIPQ